MKKGEIPNKERLDFLNQLVLSLEQAEHKLEQAYERKKPEQFNAAKQFIIKINKRIWESSNEEY